MNITAAESSVLAAVAYDRTRELLQLEFHNGSSYRYFGVPATVYEALLSARSRGSYFNRAVRGRFPFGLVSQAQGEVQNAQCPAPCR